MSFRLGSDPTESLRKVEKFLLMVRFGWRFPRIKGAWPKYEFLKPWIVDLAPATVVDVGVNHGQFLHLATRLWPKARFLGIEPNAALVEKMTGLYANDPRVRIEACAVSDREGEAELFLARDDQSSSIHAPAEHYYDDREGDAIVGSATVPLRRMDALLAGYDAPMFLKIDVQGAELEVLRGFGDRLGDAAAIVIEAPFEQAYVGAAGFDEIHAYLSSSGFQYEGSLGQLTSNRTGRVRQQDAVYVKRAPR